MTPQEKAKELIEKFKSFVDTDKAGTTGLVYDRNVMIYNSKQCALIAVEEVLDHVQMIESELYGYTAYNYFKLVKQEINKI